MKSQYFSLISSDEAARLESGRFGYTLIRLDGILYQGGGVYMDTVITEPVGKDCILLQRQHGFDLDPVAPKNRERPIVVELSSLFLEQNQFKIFKHNPTLPDH